MIYTFDIEDYYKNFCKFQLDESIDFNINFYEQTLEISNYLNKNKIKGIFFILGEVAEYFPNLVKQIHKDNHIIGLHGYDHENINNFTKEKFKKDLKKSIDIFKSIDKNITINHYRSPGFSMLNNINEYYEVLNEMEIYNLQEKYFNLENKKIEIEEKLKLTETATTNQKTASKVLSDLAYAASSGIALIEIKYDGGNTYIIKGDAIDDKTVVDYINSVRKAEIFEKVILEKSSISEENKDIKTFLVKVLVNSELMNSKDIEEGTN